MDLTRRMLIGTLLSVLLVSGVSAQGTTDTLQKIKESGTVVLGHRDASIPFSYLDDQQQPVGYSMDICLKVVNAIKAELNMPNLKVTMNPVTSATRIPLMQNGTIDLECGSTTNNLERQKQVGFAVTTFVTANRLVAKKASGIKTLNDMKGKTIVSTSGTTNIKQMTELNTQRSLGMTIMPAKDHAEAFLMMETGRAVAFAMDDILLYSLVASSKTPDEFAIAPEALSVEPYGIMLRKDDAAFKKVVDNAIIGLFKSGEINAMYTKWFLSPIPPKNITLNVAMSDALKKVIANPTDSGDPKDY